MPKTILFDKDEVLEKVTLLFWEKGYNGTSMQDLVDVTGLSRSSFYNTFKGGKFELFIEALKHYQKEQNQYISHFKEIAKSPKEVITLIFDSICQEVDKGNHKGCFLSNCTTELGNLNDNISDFLTHNLKNIVEMFKNLIEEGQNIGEIDKNKNADILAKYLFSSLQGLRITSMLDKNTESIKSISSQILEVL